MLEAISDLKSSAFEIARLAKYYDISSNLKCLFIIASPFALLSLSHLLLKQMDGDHF